MTINEKALEAATEAVKKLSIDYGISNSGEQLTYEQIALTAIEAYEASLWRPIEELADGKIVIMYALMDTETGNWKMATGCKHNGEFTWDGDRLREWSILPTHFRPLPTFKEQE